MPAGRARSWNGSRSCESRERWVEENRRTPIQILIHVLLSIAFSARLSVCFRTGTIDSWKGHGKPRLIA